MAHEVVFARMPQNYHAAFIEWTKANGFIPNHCRAGNAYISDDGKTITMLIFKLANDGKRIYAELKGCPVCGQHLNKGTPEEKAAELSAGAVTYAETRELVADPKDFGLIVTPLPEGTPTPTGTIALVAD